jgi:enoyl-CoA hydratase/carnithine racemase
MYETLLVERDGPVGWLTFNRPSAANAMDARMMHELEPRGSSSTKTPRSG